MAKQRQLALEAFIRQHTEQNTLLAEWDAGGDCTLLSIYIVSPNGNKTHVDDRKGTSGLLWDSVVKTLQLPNAGEHYHHGKARIYLDEVGAPKLRVTSREYTLSYDYDWTGDNDGRLQYRLTRWEEREADAPQAAEAPREVVVPIENQHSAEAILHRAEVWLVGNIDRELNTRTGVHVEIIDGDEARLDDLAEAYYQTRISSVLTDLCPLLEGDQAPAGIHVEARLQPGAQARFRVITDAYQQLRIYNAESVKLEGPK